MQFASPFTIAILGQGARIHDSFQGGKRVVIGNKNLYTKYVICVLNFQNLCTLLSPEIIILGLREWERICNPPITELMSGYQRQKLLHA